MMTEETITVEEIFSDDEGERETAIVFVEAVNLTTGEVGRCTLDEAQTDRFWAIAEDESMKVRTMTRHKRKTWATNKRAAAKLKATRKGN